MISDKSCTYYSSYCYYWLFSVYRSLAHNRVVVFHTLHIFQRDTKICPYLVNFATFYTLLLSQLRGSSVLTLLHFILSDHHRPSPPPPPSPLPLTGQFTPVTTTVSPSTPPVSSMTPLIGIELVASQYTVQQ